ncbi:MAG: HAD family hydrolase, partial [Candidatus Rokuibacteriota bacterium]
MASRPARSARAVFFDAGNTLVRMDYAAIAGELLGHGVRVSATDVQQAEWRARVVLDAELGARPSRHASTEAGSAGDLYSRLILAELGVEDGRVIDAVAAWRRAYNPPVGLWNTVEPVAEAALRLVRAAGRGAAVISNSNGSVRGILDSLGLGRHLDFVLDSSEVGVEKPDARIFRLALQRAGLGPGAAVYVGDLYSVDVLGARGAGLTAVLLDPGAGWGARDCPTAPDVLAA